MVITFMFVTVFEDRDAKKYIPKSVCKDEKAVRASLPLRNEYTYYMWRRNDTIS